MFETDELNRPTFIPESLWNDWNIFANNIPNNLKKLLSDNFDNLCFKLQFHIPNLEHFHNRLKLWLGYNLLYPTLEHEQIHHLSNKLAFNVQERNLAATILGRWDLIQIKPNDDLMQYFKIAYSHHHTDYILKLFIQYPCLKPLFISHNNYEVFIHACRHGDIALLDLLFQQNHDQLPEMIGSRNYLAFREACRLGQTASIQYLFIHAQEYLLPMLKSEQYDGFFMACEQGFTDILKLIATHVPHEMTKILSMKQFKAFRLSIKKRHLETFHFIIEYNQACLVDMLSVKQYQCFELACSKNSSEMIQTLIKLAEQHSCTSDMLSSQNFLNFNQLCANGNLNIIQYYMSFFDERKIIDLIQSNGYLIFSVAAENNQIEVIQYFMKIDSLNTSAMLRSFEFHPLIELILCGHLDFFNFIAEKYPEVTQDLLHAHEFKMAKKAARTDQFLLFKKIFQLLPHERHLDLIRSEQFAIFTATASANNVECLSFIIQQCPELQEEMLSHNNFAAFRIADLFNQEKSIHFLLEFPQVFCFAEQSLELYNLSVFPFILQKIEEIKIIFSESTEIQMTENEAKIYFYIIRHFIRCHNPLTADQTDLIQQLIQSIPSLRAILANEVTPNAGENELLRFALSLRHHTAIEVLLTHEIVREHAFEHDFYRLEVEDGIQIQTLAADQESSMKALTPQEEIRLDTALKRYQPMLDSLTPKIILKQLITQLENQYQQNPAQCDFNADTVLLLPLRMEDFNQLNLADNHRQQALNQYYKHPVHTCWRFFQMPNPWIHPEAAYTLHNPVNQTQRWANYQNYIPLIATLYLAVNDEQYPACDGFTIESRFQHFINEIALLNRAHNWDKTRIIIDKDGKQIQEAYDNKEGDQPSCYSGMKRRLFQAVLGHSLFKILTIDIVRMEVNDFIMQHMQASISEDNYEQLQEAWYQWIEELSLQAIPCLKSLDINLEQQKSFLIYLNQKYDKQFSNDPIFQRIVQEAFHLKGSNDAHLFKCRNVEQLLSKHKIKKALQSDAFFKHEEDTSLTVSRIKRKCHSPPFL